MDMVYSPPSSCPRRKLLCMDIWSTAKVMGFPGSREDSRAVRDAKAQQVPRDPWFPIWGALPVFR